MYFYVTIKVNGQPPLSVDWNKHSLKQSGCLVKMLCSALAMLLLHVKHLLCLQWLSWFWLTSNLHVSCKFVVVTHLCVLTCYGCLWNYTHNYVNMHMHAYHDSVRFLCMHMFVYMCVHVENLWVHAYIYAWYLLWVNISSCVRMCMTRKFTHM